MLLLLLLLVGSNSKDGINNSIIIYGIDRLEYNVCTNIITNAIDTCWIKSNQIRIKDDCFLTGRRTYALYGWTMVWTGRTRHTQPETVLLPIYYVTHILRHFQV